MSKQLTWHKVLNSKAELAIDRVMTDVNLLLDLYQNLHSLNDQNFVTLNSQLDF